jgi:hypothetical protein
MKEVWPIGYLAEREIDRRRRDFSESIVSFEGRDFDVEG